MDSGLIIVLLWIGFLILGQWTRKRPPKKPGSGVQLPKLPKLSFPKGPQPVKRQPAQPGTFTCEEAAATEPLGHRVTPTVQEQVEDLKPTIQPLKEDLKVEIRDLTPEVPLADAAPQAPKPQNPLLAGGLRQGMAWAMVLGKPRSLESWDEEQGKHF